MEHPDAHPVVAAALDTDYGTPGTAEAHHSADEEIAAGNCPTGEAAAEAEERLGSRSRSETLCYCAHLSNHKEAGLVSQEETEVLGLVGAAEAVWMR